MIFIVTEIFILTLSGATAALVFPQSGIPFISGVSVTCAFPEATLSTPHPRRISNKFLYHHCHVDTAKEGNMLNVQSVPNITPCVIVSQRKPIVCPGEAPQSQGLSSDS